MKLKVKVRDTELMMDKITADPDSTVGALIRALVEKNLVNINFTGGLKVQGLEDEDPVSLPLHRLFETGGRAEIYNRDMTVTLTRRRTENDNPAGSKLLDYSKFMETVDKFHGLARTKTVRAGTLFYVQQQHRQYFVRVDDAGLEFFHFRNQYDEAFRETGRQPFLAVELKTREALSAGELNWIRSVTFPSKEKKNPVIHAGRGRLSQEVIDGINVLIHRIIVIIGRFRTHGEALDAETPHIPAYVQVGEECSVGYITKEQLEKVKK
ncbi:MAG TPA: hypothetical protein H9891_04865 [Candidatus Salinicoccus stercoripullorum]|uniref:Uncharacterized protein n=1 Tax=Candidatus Salinicoccus stercoripullorum TaxID=2838756 RepID=A0A9D1QH75_9STAP|nr:hypothetical protein [Candidatus Salinicoccus stercoripullorum]